MTAAPRGLVRDASIAAALAFLASLLVFWPIRHLWGASWGPGDLLSTYNNVSVWNGLWFQTSASSGFPGNMNLNLFPGIDITQNSLALALGAFSDSPFLGLNLVIIASFPITAAFAVVAMRLMRLAGPWAIVLALAFTFIPYHWGRSLGHAYLGTTYAAVTGVILALIIARGLIDIPRRATVIGTAGLLVITAWSGVYYAAFGMLLIAIALIWRALTGATIATLARNGLILLSLVIISAAALIPAAIARFTESISSLGNRPPYESVELAGSLALAVLPAPVSIAPYMGYYNEAILELTSQAPYTEALALTNYGTWTSLAALLFALGWAFLRIRHRLGLPPEFTFAAFALAVLTLFFVPWGLNSLFANFISAQIRAWNRLVPTLLLLVFLLVASAIAHSPAFLQVRAALLGSAIVFVVIVVDQVLPYRALYATTATRYAQDTADAQQYAVAANTAIPENCGVIQLPFMIYPENGPMEPELNDYEHFWHSLLNTDKSWSYGAVRGTSAEATVQELSRAAERGEFTHLLDQGVCAIHIDTRGYSPDKGQAILDRLELATGGPAAIGKEGDWLLFDIRDGGSRT